MIKTIVCIFAPSFKIIPMSEVKIITRFIVVDVEGDAIDSELYPSHNAAVKEAVKQDGLYVKKVEYIINDSVEAEIVHGVDWGKYPLIVARFQEVKTVPFKPGQNILEQAAWETMIEVMQKVNPILVDATLKSLLP